MCGRELGSSSHWCPIFLLLWDLCGHTLLADLKMIRGVGFVEFILVQTVYNDTVCPCLEKCILLHMQNAQQHKECWEKVGWSIRSLLIYTVLKWFIRLRLKFREILRSMRLVSITWTAELEFCPRIVCVCVCVCLYPGGDFKLNAHWLMGTCVTVGAFEVPMRKQAYKSYKIIIIIFFYVKIQNVFCDW